MFQWPYSYDSCDVGTLPNQTYPGTSTPLAALQNGDPGNNNVLVCCLLFNLGLELTARCHNSHIFQVNACVRSSALTVFGNSNYASCSCMYMSWRVSSRPREGRWLICWKIGSRNRCIRSSYRSGGRQGLCFFHESEQF